MTTLHPLLARFLRKAGASPDAPPSPEAWQAFLGLVDNTLHAADEDRYTADRAMDVLSVEMQGLYRELERKTRHEIDTLRNSDERHRLLFEQNPLPIWVIDTENRQFLAVNDAMVRIYGYSREELLAATGDILKTADDIPLMIEAIRAAADAGMHRVGVRKHRCKDGTVLDMDISAHPLVFEGRSALICIALDTTRAKRLEEELRHAQKMEAIGLLAGGVAHDFNNILAVILANAEFGLEDVGPENEVAAQLFSDVRDAARRGSTLTRQLLTFSRKQKRQARPLAIGAIVTELRSMLTRVVGPNIQIETRVAADLGTIEADRGEIEQVMMNLVVNARDAMSDGGHIGIQLANVAVDHVEASHLGLTGGRYIAIAVSDTGCGMSAEVQARIFEPFFTTKDLDRGTGLGLATVFGIVKQSGGAITVSSEVGRGSTFCIYLPRIDSVAVAATESEFVAPRESATVMLVEDNTPFRNVLKRHLATWGYTIVEAPNGAEALALIDDQPIDILVTDLAMPELDGRALASRVRASHPEITIVFMSGYAEQGPPLSPDDLFMQKPFSARMLAETLQRALTSARARESAPVPLRAVATAEGSRPHRSSRSRARAPTSV